MSKLCQQDGVTLLKMLLSMTDERDKRIIDTLSFLNGRLDKQPDIHFHVSIPVEFQKWRVNYKYSVNILGVEWTVLILIGITLENTYQ